MSVATQPGSGGPAVACAGLTKDYGRGHGLFDLDLVIEPGEVFGFVGPNGAAKTTTIGLLMDLIRPDRGWCCGARGERHGRRRGTAPLAVAGRAAGHPRPAT